MLAPPSVRRVVAQLALVLALLHAASQVAFASEEGGAFEAGAAVTAGDPTWTYLEAGARDARDGGDAASEDGATETPSGDSAVEPPAEASAPEPEPVAPSLVAEDDAGIEPFLPGDSPRDEVTPPPVDGPAPPPAETPSSVVIKTILGLVVLMVLAYVGGHPRVRRWEKRTGVAQLITAGFPFVALGMVARLPRVDVLSDEVLAQLAPVLRIALAWIGFLVGFRFDTRALTVASPGAVTFAATRTAVTAAVIVAASAALLVVSEGAPLASLATNTLVRDALVLGTAGAMSSTGTARLLAARGARRDAMRFVARVARFDELAGVVGLLVITAYFRPDESGATWQLPRTAWLLVAVGLGTTVGLLVYAVLLRPRTSPAEWTLLVLGSVAFSAGMAGNLHLSPVVVCFVVGLLVANFPGAYKEGLRQTLSGLERPIYLVFLVIVGALWDVSDWRGWLLMLVFVVARIGGKWLGTRLGSLASQTTIPSDTRHALVLSPMGPLAIAIVVTAQVLRPTRTLSLVVTAILGGAVITELVVQFATRASRRPPSEKEKTAP